MKALIETITARADAARVGSAPVRVGDTGLTYVRAAAPTRYDALLYRPLVCVVLQGCKETTFGAEVVRFGAGQSLIVALDLPAVSRVRTASAEAPYVALALELDLGLIRTIDAEMAGGDRVRDTGAPAAFVIAVGQSDPRLVDAMARLLDLADRPEDDAFLRPLLLREIHYRLLSADHAGMLRRLAGRETHASQIARAVAMLRRDYAAPLRVAGLAAAAGMSPSSFHEHFKALTATTPLQYQKALRLLAARERVAGDEPVGSIALAVGYQSPAQFSRDYARHFGCPPTAHRRAGTPPHASRGTTHHADP